MDTEDKPIMINVGFKTQWRFTLVNLLLMIIYEYSDILLIFRLGRIREDWELRSSSTYVIWIVINKDINFKEKVVANVHRFTSWDSPTKNNELSEDVDDDQVEDIAIGPYRPLQNLE